MSNNHILTTRKLVKEFKQTPESYPPPDQFAL